MEKKANVLLYVIIMILLVVIIAAIAFVYKAAEFNRFKEIVNNFKEKENYTYVVYEENKLNPIYSLKYLNKKYRITKEGEPGFIEGDLNKNDAIHFLAEKDAYSPIKKDSNILKYFPEKIEKKYNIKDFFNKEFLQKTKINGEEVVEYKSENKEGTEIYIIATKDNTLRQYEKKDKDGKVIEKKMYKITVGDVKEEDVEPIDRNNFEVKTSEEFEHLKNEIMAERQKEEEKKENEAKENLTKEQEENKDQKHEEVKEDEEDKKEEKDKKTEHENKNENENENEDDNKNHVESI